MTYSYVLLVGGEQWGEPLPSAAEGRAARARYTKENPDDREARGVLVGRMVRDERQQGRGLFNASIFREGAASPDPDIQFWHHELRDLLNEGVRPRSFFLWLSVEQGNGLSSLDKQGFVASVKTWL